MKQVSLSSMIGHNMTDCKECYGTGRLYFSCCGDDMSDSINETDLCPTCLEHCGDEGEECDACFGLGIDPNAPFVLNTKHFTITRSKNDEDRYIFKSKTTNTYFVLDASLEYVLSL